VWDIDNPDWSPIEGPGTSHLATAEPRALRLFVENVLAPFIFLAAEPDDGSTDPNTSETFFDDADSHYILARATVVEPDIGMVGVMMHSDYIYWRLYGYAYEPWDGWMAIGAFYGVEVAGAEHGVGDHPGEPNYPEGLGPNDIRAGDSLWMVLQYDANGPNWDANNPDDPNDPNCHWLRGAAWVGRKFDWNGVYHMEVNARDPDDWDVPSGYVLEDFIFTEGTFSVASFSGGDAGDRSDIAYDNVEGRWGTFTNISHSLDVRKIKSEDYGSVTIDPDVLDRNDTNDPNDPNHGDPNDYSELRRYTDGTEVVLVADPCDDRGWKKWKIWDDPNRYPDSNYVTEDTNAVIYLTMDRDYVVEAIFSCSASSSAMPPVAMVLVLLTLAVAVRRLT
jgi:hypothetical protein